MKTILTSGCLIAVLTFSSALSIVEAAPPAPRKQTYTVTFSPELVESWRDLAPTLMEDLAKPKTTHRFCDPTPNKLANGFTLQCTPGKDNKIPLKFGAFGWLEIAPTDTITAQRLVQNGFIFPYSSEWLGTQTGAFIKIEAGNVAALMATPLPLRQADGCVNNTYKPTLKDLYLEELGSLPAPPCRQFRFSVAGAPATLGITIRSGCRIEEGPVAFNGPGTPSAAVCLRKVGAPAPKLSVELLSTFEPVIVPLPDNNDSDYHSAFADLQSNLVMKWPFDSASPTDRINGIPLYMPWEVSFLTTDGKTCGPLSLPPDQNPPRVRPLKDFGCSKLPAKAKITFKQKSVDLPGAPRAAFKNEFSVTYDLFTGAWLRETVSLEALKLELPIGFTKERGEAYDSKYGTGVNNAFPGAQMMRDCNARPDGRTVPFVPSANSVPLKGKYPVNAIVIDSNGEPVTRCATSTVETSGPSGPMLTFEFEESRAVGPRRLVIVATGSAPQRAMRTLKRAITTSLDDMIDVAARNKQQGLRLSPVNVLFWRSDASFEEAFTGEGAAFNPTEAKQAVAQKFPATPLGVPDFDFLESQPQGKMFDQIVIIMDGANTDTKQFRVLQDWSSERYKRKVTLFITSPRCDAWVPIDCHVITDTQDVQSMKKPVADRLMGLMVGPAQPASGIPAPHQGRQAPGKRSTTRN